jgi:very-short-patch-repair endonuclease
MSLRRTPEWLAQHNLKMGKGTTASSAARKKRSGQGKDKGGSKIIASSASGESILESTLELHLKASKITGYVREFEFHPVRKWRADFAWPELNILVECEGGLNEWDRGRHMRGDGYVRDLEKYNAATLAGFMVLRFDYQTINSGMALLMIERAISVRTGSSLDGAALQSRG